MRNQIFSHTLYDSKSPKRHPLFLICLQQACKWGAWFYPSYRRQIINSGLDVLEENMFAGQLVEKKKFPKLYIQKYGVNNLFKYNIDLEFILRKLLKSIN
jgi:hypothetical protein